MSTTAHLSNGKAKPENDNNRKKKPSNVKMTNFKKSQLTEEAIGFYESLEEANQVLNSVKGFHDKKNSVLYDFLYEEVYEATPIASRAVVCLHRANQMEVLLHAGLRRNKPEDQRTYALLTKVRQVYLDLHDKACGVKIFWMPARAKTNRRISELMLLRDQKRHNEEVLKKTITEPFQDVASGMIAALSAISGRLDNVHRENTTIVRKLTRSEDTTKELRSEIAKLRKEVADMNEVVKPLRKKPVGHAELKRTAV